MSFKINDYLTLKKKANAVNIYINEEKFNQCKSLYLTNFQDKKNRLELSLDDKFFGFCSSIQAWADEDYSPDLLHHSLMIPILKGLTDAKDLQARKVFKKQIAIRLTKGHPKTVLFLLENNYLNYFNSLNLNFLFQKLNELSPDSNEDHILKLKCAIFERLFEINTRSAKKVLKKRLNEEVNNILLDKNYLATIKRFYTKYDELTKQSRSKHKYIFILILAGILFLSILLSVNIS